MDEHPFDDTATDALLDGKVTPAQAPEGLQQAAALILLARSRSTVTDRATERQTVSQMGAIVRGEGSTGAAADSRFAAHRARFAAVAAVAAFVALSGGAVAAAAGALPNPVQRVVSSGFADLGLSVPTPATHPSTTEAPPTTLRHPLTGAVGLCTAYEASLHNPTAAAKKAGATAFVRLATLARSRHETVAALCAQLLDGRRNTRHGPPPSTISPPTTTKSKGHGKPDTHEGHGPPHPPGPNPGKGHDGTDGHGGAGGGSGGSSGGGGPGSGGGSGSHGGTTGSGGGPGSGGGSPSGPHGGSSGSGGGSGHGHG
jgi:hypothetical protein